MGWVPHYSNGQSRTPVPTGECCTNDNGANSTVSKFVSTFKRLSYHVIRNGKVTMNENENKTLPQRKSIRWDKQNYSHPGVYTITICTKDMKQILSEIIVGNPQTVGTGVPDRPF